MRSAISVAPLKDAKGPEAGRIYHNTKCPPEIVISYACNKKCPYCYAEGQKSDEIMPVAKFKKIGGWFKQVLPSLESITILGGEPLIMENIGSYIDSARDVGLMVNFFTNGSFGMKNRNIVASSPAVDAIYFHYEPVHFCDESHRKTFLANLKYAHGSGKRVKLRVNFHGANFEYMGLLEIAAAFDIPIAWSITSPAKNMRDYVRHENFVEIGGILSAFISKCFEFGVNLELVRPVQKCIFPEGVFEKFKEYSNLDKTCNVASYVRPDGTVQFCTILDDVKKGPIKSAEELADAIFHFQSEEARLRKKPSFGACKTCGRPCQGGCLSYKVYGDGK